jgi:hypothetical protein
MLNRRVLWLSPGLMGLLGWWRGVSRLAFVVACRVVLAWCVVYCLALVVASRFLLGVLPCLA